MSDANHHAALSALLRRREPSPPPRRDDRHALIDLEPNSIRPGPRLRRRWLPWLFCPVPPILGW